jgi:hypothetical protein
MKSRIVLSLLCVLIDATAAFESKALRGCREGKGDGHAVQISNRIPSGGSALMSEMQGQQDMVSMIRLDDDRLMFTHYCPLGNQPRLAATISPDGKTITVNFLEATHLLSSQEGHLTRAVFTLIDSDHHTEDYEFSTAEGKKMNELLDLRRTK